MAPRIVSGSSDKSTDSSTSSTSSSYSHLLTPEIIAKARAYRGVPSEKKYVHVIDSQYTIKLGPGVKHYEYRVLQFLAKHTKAPTPRPIDFFTTYLPKETFGIASRDGDMEEWNVILMSTMRGKSLDKRRLSEEQRIALYRQVRTELDGINKAIDLGCTFPDRHGNWVPLQRSGGILSGLDGSDGKVLNMPLLNGYVEGTVHPDRFIETMTPTAAQPPDTFALLQSILHALAPSDIKATRFCHMDIHPGNIMVRNGRLSGIIDWEMSGWYNWQIESYAASHVVFYDPSYGPVLTAAWDTEPTLITSGSFDRMLLEGGFTQWRISARTAKRSRSTDVRQHRQDKQKVKRKSSTRKPQGGLGLDLSSLDI